jgi:hypothetical protein
VVLTKAQNVFVEEVKRSGDSEIYLFTRPNIAPLNCIYDYFDGVKCEERFSALKLYCQCGARILKHYIYCFPGILDGHIELVFIRALSGYLAVDTRMVAAQCYDKKVETWAIKHEALSRSELCLSHWLVGISEFVGEKMTGPKGSI